MPGHLQGMLNGAGAGTALIPTTYTIMVKYLTANVSIKGPAGSPRARVQWPPQGRSPLSARQAQRCRISGPHPSTQPSGGAMFTWAAFSRNYHWMESLRISLGEYLQNADHPLPDINT